MKYEFLDITESGRVCGRVTWSTDPDGLRYYCTNGEAEGVFRVNLRRGERVQVVGTCNFSLYGMTKASARAAVRRFMNR